MASGHDLRAHPSDRESSRKRDRFFIRPFKSNKSAIATNTESQIPRSEQSSKVDLKPMSSKSEKSRQASLDTQNSSVAVDQTQSLPQIGTKGKRDTANDGDRDQSEYLWMRAYKALENRDPDLVAAHACHLDLVRSDKSSTTPTDPALSPKLIETIIKDKLQDNEARKMVFHLGRQSIKVREQGEKIIKFILWSHNFISAAVCTQPYAALAWSGVSVLLLLLLNSSKQIEAMLTGLSSIADMLRLYQIREELYLHAVDRPAHPDFVNAIVELYTDIFEYQARLILYLSRSSLKRGLQSTFEQNDWSGMLERIQSSNARCTEFTALFDKDKEHQFYTEQSSQIMRSNEIQKRILEMFEAFHDTKDQGRQDDKEAQLLQTLASDYKTDKYSISTRVPGTCEWVFQDMRFREWRDSTKSSLLWISAGPGCGKSVLSRCLIDEKRLCTNVMTSTTCYFFFKDGQDQRSEASNATSAILHQLFKDKCGSSLLTYALSSHKSFGVKLQSMFSELWDILTKSAEDPEAGEIVCVLDALDECQENSRNQLVEKLVGLVSKTSNYSGNSSPTLKFLVTSRPYEDLELGFRPISSINTFRHIDGDENSERIGQEIHLVIDAKVPHIAGDFNVEDRKKISDRLKKLDNRTYLWLFLTVNIIERSRSKYGKMSSIHKLLSSLPSSVANAYEEILNKSTDKDKAKILLQILLAARRPLSLGEANIALSIATLEERCRSHNALELWPPASFKSTIQNICGLFITVYDSKIFLIHQTARAFLISTGLKSDATSSWEWKGCINMSKAHGTLSQICLQYLDFQDFASIPRDSSDESTTTKYPFLAYAAVEWPIHYTSQDMALAQSSRKGAGMLCRTSLPQFSYWSRIYCQSKPEKFCRGNWTELGIASHLGLSYVVEDFLSEGTVINAINGADNRSEDGTALMIASVKGHEKIVEMLLNHNADVNAESEPYGTALKAATWKGHEKIVDMLLNHNADASAGSRKGVTALIAASIEGHEKIVEMLLNHNADVNAESEFHGTALMMASWEGHEKIVGMLLNHNADVNAGSETYTTALTVASQKGYEKIVEMLLNHNADVNAESGPYGTALMIASWEGHEKIVEMLLNHNADVNAGSETYTTALTAASQKGYEKIVEMLLNHNADVNAGSETYGTALIIASWRGHEKIVEMLLNHNADVNAESEKWGTALIVASQKGYEKIVEMLLNHNADVNAEREFHATVLIIASWRGHEKIVEMLLNHNADVNAESEKYGTALIAASQKGYEKIVEMLLNHNADVNAESEKYGTALIVASQKGYEKIVEMLLNHNADVNAESEKYGTALIIASWRGHEKIVEMLLNHNADVNAESEKWGTALIAASQKGYEKIVEMLLNHNADVNAGGGRYGTALTAASRGGHEKIVEMLLNHNADVNAGSETYTTALTAASREGYEKIVEMLLNHNADVNVESEPCGTALIIASWRGHEKIVEMLLNHNADVNAEIEFHATALAAASLEGHEKIVEMLLNHNADVNAESEFHATALVIASREGHKKIVEMLLNQNADVNVKSRCDTALTAAAARGHIEIVEILRARGGVEGSGGGD